MTTPTLDDAIAAVLTPHDRLPMAGDLFLEPHALPWVAGRRTSTQRVGVERFRLLNRITGVEGLDTPYPFVTFTAVSFVGGVENPSPGSPWDRDYFHGKAPSVSPGAMTLDYFTSSVQSGRIFRVQPSVTTP